MNVGTGLGDTNNESPREAKRKNSPARTNSGASTGNLNLNARKGSNP